MEDKKLLTNEELEKVSGGSYTLDYKEESAFRSAEVELKRIIDNRADDNYRSNVKNMFYCCRKALVGSISVETALDRMQHYCNQINIDYRWDPQNILDQLRSSLSR